MVAVYALSVFFLGWLALVLSRVLRLYLAMRKPAGRTAGGPGAGAGVWAGPGFGPGAAGSRTPGVERLQRLAVLVRDRADYAEGLVRRLVAGLNRYPAMQTVLVDGGSSDETSLILERLAFRFNLGFCRLEDLGPVCPRTSSLNIFMETPDCCRAACFAKCGPSPGGSIETSGLPVPVHCLDLCHVSGKKLLRINLFDTVHFSFRNGG
ncbi:glycosyltransferase family 2 protein [Desulfallas sp. Bu1-1]|uniref:glycosyltransferase family A protein n=1 Tax=Desulfallas sp. Bu1-1 TaxID=2787620 RepID=UPI00189DD513|nr:glycosyltransferase family A protein [Desulfallas sp. Bu1-1]MBF7081632.1 glycosyltransferase family 2 protein [Desulfallas sp. Bu1-1]